MSDNSAILALPYIQPSQAQKHVTHNEALARLDVLVQLSLVGFGAETPPVAPALGETHALGLNPVDGWAGQGNALATWRDGGWHFIDPQVGWRAFGGATGELRVWDGAAWLLPPADTENLNGVGIGTSSDATNRLSVKGDATLLSHDGAGHRVKINKATGGDTASLLFQSDWTGHAEMGLTGGTDFAIKVSADGSSWSEALRIDGASGNLVLANNQALTWLDSNGVAQPVLRVDSGDNLILRSAGGGRALKLESNAGTVIMVVKETGKVGIGTTSPLARLSMKETANSTAMSVDCSNVAYSEQVIELNVRRAATPAFSFGQWWSGDFGDLEFQFSGDGNGTCDGSWSGGGADYAEYFEWADGNPADQDRRGIAVVLDGDQICEAAPGQEPIGVISGNPSVVGDSAALRWKGKYLRDDYGSALLEEYEAISWADGDAGGAESDVHSYAADTLPAGLTPPKDAVRTIQTRRQLSPGYDPKSSYTPRSGRVEWDMVGLMGKLRLRKGQATGARWIKMRDISDQVEEWLVR